MICSRQFIIMSEWKYIFISTTMESHILLFHVIGILSGLNAILRARTAEGP